MHEDTIETWFDLYGQDVFNYLVYYTSSIDVEDLVQETFTKAWIKLRNYVEIESPKAWLFSIARNTATDAIRRKKRPIENTVRNDALLNSLASHLSVEDKVQFNDEKRRLTTALLALKQSYREVLILRGIEDMSVSATAQILITVKPQTRRKGVIAFKSVGVALSGAAVAAVLLTNIPLHWRLANTHETTGAGGSSLSTANTTLSTSTALGTNTTDGASATSVSTAQTPYSYFGIKASLKPMVPSAMAQRYHVKASELYVYTRDPNSSFFRGDRYSGLYVDPNSQAQIQLSEVIGNSISDYTEGANAMTVAWQTTKQVNGQTYYIHPASTQPGEDSNIVGFVRDNVVYELASMQLSMDSLLTLAQGELQPAQVNVAYRYAGETYDLAISNITFKPLMLPKSLSSQWDLYSMGSGLTKTSDQCGYQDVSMEYRLSNNGNQLFDVIETPLQNANQEDLNLPVYSTTKTWNDYKYGLEIEVSGNISQAQLNQVVSAMQASK